jgi:SAM-dependent methyltransferase
LMAGRRWLQNTLISRLTSQPDQLPSTCRRSRAIIPTNIRDGTIGCGGGETVLDLARAVAPDGTVVGIDLSAVVLAFAQRAAQGCERVSRAMRDPPLRRSERRAENSAAATASSAIELKQAEWGERANEDDVVVYSSACFQPRHFRSNLSRGRLVPWHLAMTLYGRMITAWGVSTLSHQLPTCSSRACE